MVININVAHQPILGVDIYFSFSEFLKNLRNKIGTPESLISILENLDKYQNLHILIADDDPDDQELLAEAFYGISPNIKITFADNGKDLMSMLTGKTHPDMIFLDLNMPAMNGFECLSKIKSHPDLQILPILIYSTSAHEEQVEKTYHQGANFYIQKPSNFNDIKDVIRKILTHTVEEFYTQPARGKFLIRS
ncbi:MAG: response regulator [Fulvivirga sp.]